MDVTSQILKNQRLISDQVTLAEVRVILQEIERLASAGHSGAVLEMGCYIGTTSLFISRLLQALGYEGEFHVYDSFSGLPPKRSEDQSPAGTDFIEGALTASRAEFVKVFQRNHVPLPVIHKGWFEELSRDVIPQSISFVFLDGDYYSSILSCLTLIESNLLPGSCLIVDDYLSSSLPGARRATDLWLRSRGIACTVREGMAVIKLPNK